MSDFDTAFIWLMGSEGGYSNNPVDPGGETMWGITQRVAQANGYTGAMIDLTQNQAKSIAKKCYWDVYQCDQFALPVAFQVFDAAYNGGHPAQWLQQAAAVAVDGVMGPNTIKAVNAVNPVMIAARFIAMRIRYLTSLPGWATFGKGWANRMADNLNRAAGT